jgi:CDGSH-type Zn-finger protein
MSDTGPKPVKITVTKDGSYMVTGGPPLTRQAIASNAAEESVDWTAEEPVETPGRYFLCRCGHSANKPFCDGSHTKVGFDGTETASRDPYLDQAKAFDGPKVLMTDAESLCAFARFCDRNGAVWNEVSEATTDEARDALLHQIGQCPSGRLVAWDKQTGDAIEPDLPVSLVLTEDPQQDASGPIWARGGIEIVGADGVAYEVRNRVTLCRCGASSNKPFCDGTHASIHFSDKA